MKIGLKPRQGGHVCPYCRDDVVRGPACSACKAQYHVECAETFGKCAARGCAGTFAGILELVQTFPRLALLARRINRWRTDDLAAGAVFVVVLMPTPREKQSKRAADVIGEVLGQTSYDGRMRLGSAYPEPLVRVGDRDRLGAILSKMRGAGLTVMAPPLGEVVAPLDAFEVARVVALGESLEFEGEAGERRSVRADRVLAIPCQLHQTEQVLGGKLMAGGSVSTYERGRSSKRIASKPPERRLRQQALYLFEAGHPVPLVLREQSLRDFKVLGAKQTISTHHNMRAMIEAVTSCGGQVREMAKTVVLNQAFMVPSNHLASKRSNEPVVALVARLMRLAWEAGLEPSTPRPARPPARAAGARSGRRIERRKR